MRSLHLSLVGLLCIFALSVYTYVPGYQKPASLFWDENFHIASAQRYLNGIFFMEPHPPLGKLFIAAGEALLKSNTKNDQFISLEQASEIPDGFSFAGYRLFPVLFATLVPALIYLILLQTTNSVPISFFVSIIPALDNALIVHSRGAMLEGPQLFFVLLAVFSYFRFQKDTPKGNEWLSILGVSTACALLIKINSAAILILPIFILLRNKSFFTSLAIYYFIPLVFTYLTIWQVHFALGSKINPNLENQGFFSASAPLKEAIIKGRLYDPRYLVRGIKDSFYFSKKYQHGVDKLNYCKADENGSYPLLWPLGARTIQYRWDDTEQGTKYLYLVPNPWGWILGIFGAIGACSFLISKLLGVSINLKNQSALLLITLIYFSTWLAPLLMDRVFYLYHYFVPLNFSWILLGLVCAEAKQIGAISTSIPAIRWLLASSSTILLVSSFIFFKPLTYHLPLTNTELNKRNLLSLWDLRCKNCNSINPFARPTISDAVKRRTDSEWKLSIGDLSANYIEQSIGTPNQSGNSFHIMTRSRIQFPLNKSYSTLTGIASLDPDHLDGEVEFKIIGDGVEIWNSGTLTLEKPRAQFNLNVSNIAVVILIAKTPDSADAATDAIWGDLSLNK